MNRFCVIFCLMLFSFHLGYGIQLSDSIGVTDKNNKKFIVHVVEMGETIFAISRKYKTEVATIFENNPEAKNGIDIGDKILIPLAASTNKPSLNNSTGNYHTVQQSETLFSISKLYNITIDEIKQWNNLADNTISIGDQLIIKKGATRPSNTNSINVTPPANTSLSGKKVHVVEQSQTLYSISKMYNVSTEDIKKWNNLPDNNLNIGQQLIVGSSSETTTTTYPPKDPVASDNKPENTVTNNSTNTVVPTNTSKTTEAATGRVTERGMAEVIEGTDNTKKYLALHRTAPIGTIMQVKNEMNNQSVFVRIVGTIPDAGDNSKLLLKISKKAFDRLGAVNSRFPVEISYVP